ncbi:MAG: hypothetical protein KDA61_05435 [Planctomycetales bacterium]|nr:hypothetical protein [Planctomycetales bacterium]
MLPRSLALPTLLAASVAVPYVATNAPQWKASREVAATSPSHPSGAYANPDGTLPQMREIPQQLRLPPQGPGLYPTQTPIEGIATYALNEVLRMDVTKEWVYQRWSRKSTTTADLQWFGVRVPLVSGTQIHDVAGALTYYFDQAGQVQKIALSGRTGDTSQLVQLASGPFGMTRIAAPPGEQVFQMRRGDEVISELRTRPAAVLWESNPHESFDVSLVVQRPDTGRSLVRTDTELQKILQDQRDAMAAAERSARDEAAKQAQAEAEKVARATAPDPEAANSPDGSADAWKSFFPRSRIPRSQVENLEKRRILW